MQIRGAKPANCLKTRRSIPAIHCCIRLRGRLRSEYRFCLTTHRMSQSLRARALVGAADHARMRRTLPKPEANQVRKRSTYRTNAAQSRELPRAVCKARWDNYRCSRTISLQSPDTRGTDESMQIEFAHCALRSPRCRSRDGHQNPKWQSVRPFCSRGHDPAAGISDAGYSSASSAATATLLK